MAKLKERLFQKAFLENVVKRLKPHSAATLTASASGRDVIDLLKGDSKGSVLITSEAQEVLGIITERDFVLKPLTTPELMKLPASSIMSTPVAHVTPKSSIARMLSLMTIQGVRHVPVITAGEAPKILSIRDVLDYLHEQIVEHLGDGPSNEVFNKAALRTFFAQTLSSLLPAPPSWVAETGMVSDAVTELRRNKLGCVLIGDPASEPRGIFTERDFITRVLALEMDSTVIPITKMMSAEPTGLLLSSTVSQAFTKMCAAGFRQIPVTESEGKVAGLITLKQLVGALTASIVSDLEVAQRKD